MLSSSTIASDIATALATIVVRPYTRNVSSVTLALGACQLNGRPILETADGADLLEWDVQSMQTALSRTTLMHTLLAQVRLAGQQTAAKLGIDANRLTHIYVSVASQVVSSYLMDVNVVPACPLVLHDENLFAYLRTNTERVLRDDKHFVALLQDVDLARASHADTSILARLKKFLTPSSSLKEVAP